jgi:hypothetical protein
MIIAILCAILQMILILLPPLDEPFLSRPPPPPPPLDVVISDSPPPPHSLDEPSLLRTNDFEVVTTTIACATVLSADKPSSCSLM